MSEINKNLKETYTHLVYVLRNPSNGGKKTGGYYDHYAYTTFNKEVSNFRKEGGLK